MFINIRGTGGSGKSTLARAVMDAYFGKIALLGVGARPVGYRMLRSNAMPAGPALYVCGHYETACAGGDTIKTLDIAYDQVRLAIARGDDVLLEGIMASEDVRRCAEVHHETKGAVRVFALTTPIDVCLADIRARRAVAGNEKPFNEKNTRDRVARIDSAVRKLRGQGVAVVKVTRADGLRQILASLEMPCSQ